MARIEVLPEAIHTLIQPDVRVELTQRFRELGFKFISVDLEGLRSGSLNQLVQLNADPAESH